MTQYRLEAWLLPWGIWEVRIVELDDNGKVIREVTK